MLVMEMKWQGVTPAQYDEVKAIVNWVGNPSPSGLIHIAWFDAGALRCYGVWENESDFNEFVQTRLMPAVQTTGITTQPEVRFHQAHDTFVLDRALAGSR